jgi:two-component system chemotaxis response regulator CheB
MPKARVLLADDSVVIRRVLSDLLSAEPTIEVCGVAPNGRLALAKLAQLNPDLVILDVEMPELDGIETLREIRKTHPRLPVIMFSALTERGADSTLRALALGASDYVTKPSTLSGAATTSIDQVREQLVPKIRALCASASMVSRAPARSLVPPGSSKAPPPAARSRPKPFDRPEILAIGCSTGGPNALAAFFAGLPKTVPIPIVITQHMPPVFTKALADRLTATSSIRVHEAAHGQKIEAGQAYVAPGDFHLTVQRRASGYYAELNQAPPENSCRPAVDVMFRSVAAAYGGRTLVLVMTGMGQDGLRGTELLWEQGAQVVVQDEATSVVWGMPGFIARAGLADAVLPLDALAPEVTRRMGGSRVASFAVG